jgi:hypothetical protein
MPHPAQATLRLNAEEIITRVLRREGENETRSKKRGKNSGSESNKNKKKDISGIHDLSIILWRRKLCPKYYALLIF